MPTLSSLEAKRANLHSQLEQRIGQVNRINGAISLLDDLISEWKAEQGPHDVYGKPMTLEQMDAQMGYVTSHDAPPVEPFILTGNMTPPAPVPLYVAAAEDAA